MATAKPTMTVTQFKLSYEGIGEMLKSQEVRDELTGRGEKVLAAAKANGPVDTGAYVDGLHIVQKTTDRAVVEVQGSTDHDFVVEAATGNLARSLDEARR
jgi:hypothetical protein